MFKFKNLKMKIYKIQNKFKNKIKKTPGQHIYYFNSKFVKCKFTFLHQITTK